MAENGIKIITLVHFFHLIFYFSSLYASVEGREITTHIAKKHKHAVKTIMTESGDIVDCVSLYKQPALDHPLLKNHKIQMRPSRYPKMMRKDVFESGNNISYAQLEIVHCPEGTVPILRIAKPITDKLNPNATTNFFPIASGIQEAYYWLSVGGKYNGLRSYINVWNPFVASQQDHSGVFMWAQAGSPGSTSYVDVVGAGWMVYPMVYGDNKTRFTTFWTRDNFQTGGIDRCFVLNRNSPIALGASLTPSIYKGQQQYIHVSIYQDSGNWWLIYNGILIGYWPKEILTNIGLAFGADKFAWGGAVTNNFPSFPHTEMGSGHLPYEGDSRACSIRCMQVLNHHWYSSNDLIPQITDSSSYYAQSFLSLGETYMYLGGGDTNM